MVTLKTFSVRGHIKTSQCEIVKFTLFFAQNYSKVAGKIDVTVPKQVVAAFSPGADSKTGSLGKSCGDGKWKIFQFKPLDKSERKQFMYISVEVVVSATQADTELRITEEHFNKIYFNSCGAPRYIESLLKRDDNYISSWL